jgi:hypothetical protein
VFADPSILFNQIKMSNAAGAARAIREFMRDSKVTEHCRINELPDIPSVSEENYDSLASNQWGSLAAALECLAPHAELLGLDNLGRIVKMCRERAQEEDRMTLTLSFGALNLWRKFGHLNTELLLPPFREDMRKAGLMSYSYADMLDDFGHDFRGLHEALLHVMRLEPEACDSGIVQNWDEFLSHRLLRPAVKTNFVSHDFRHWDEHFPSP